MDQDKFNWSVSNLRRRYIYNRIQHMYLIKLILLIIFFVGGHFFVTWYYLHNFNEAAAFTPLTIFIKYPQLMYYFLSVILIIGIPDLLWNKFFIFYEYKVSEGGVGFAFRNRISLVDKLYNRIRSARASYPEIVPWKNLKLVKFDDGLRCVDLKLVNLKSPFFLKGISDRLLIACQKENYDAIKLYIRNRLN